uniref:Uncharacterized protein n=1 Tax=Romanomermis culicivorax TaxID=13658 RepID=A0A915IM54_ROMCU
MSRNAEDLASGMTLPKTPPGIRHDESDKSFSLPVVSNTTSKLKGSDSSAISLRAETPAVARTDVHKDDLNPLDKWENIEKSARKKNLLQTRVSKELMAQASYANLCKIMGQFGNCTSSFKG